MRRRKELKKKIWRISLEKKKNRVDYIKNLDMKER